MLITAKYGKAINIFGIHVMLNMMISNFFPFEDNLTEKQPINTEAKIMKYTAFFNWLVLQFYQCDIMSGFRRLGHIYVCATHSFGVALSDQPISFGLSVYIIMRPDLGN